MSTYEGLIPWYLIANSSVLGMGPQGFQIQLPQTLWQRQFFFVPCSSFGATWKWLACLLLSRSKRVGNWRVNPTYSEEFPSFPAKWHRRYWKPGKEKCLGQSTFELWLKNWHPKRQFTSAEVVQIVITVTVRIADMHWGPTSYQALAPPNFIIRCVGLLSKSWI